MPEKGPHPKRERTGMLPFAYEGVERESRISSHAGAPWLVETYRATGWAAQEKGTTDRATIDLDATIVVSEEKGAATTCTGESPYQPVIALWAKRDTILADEFRDGNVPAGPLGRHRPLTPTAQPGDAPPEAYVAITIGKGAVGLATAILI